MTAAIVTAYLLCQKMQIDTIYNLPHTNHNGLKFILKFLSSPIFCDIFCDNFFNDFCDNFCDYICDEFLWWIFVTNLCDKCISLIF